MNLIDFPWKLQMAAWSRSMSGRQLASLGNWEEKRRGEERKRGGGSEERRAKRVRKFDTQTATCVFCFSCFVLMTFSHLDSTREEISSWEERGREKKEEEALHDEVRRLLNDFSNSSRRRGSRQLKQSNTCSDFIWVHSLNDSDVLFSTRTYFLLATSTRTLSHLAGH